jgi:hypothetical protein
MEALVRAQHLNLVHSFVQVRGGLLQQLSSWILGKPVVLRELLDQHAALLDLGGRGAIATVFPIPVAIPVTVWM